jgi:DNA gyrase subunit B
MKPLIMNGNIYIAQPPLYLITRKKHREYVLEEKQMRKTCTELGMDQTRLEVRDIAGKKSKVVATFEKGKLKELVDLLDDLADKAEIVHRRGIAFSELLSHRNKEGRLPTHWMILNGRNLFFHSRAEYNEFLERRADKLVDEADEVADADKTVKGKNGNGKNGNGKNGKNADGTQDAEARHRVQKRAELHEVAEIDKTIVKLAARGLDMNDYFTVREETITGEMPPARYVLITEDEPLEIDNVAEIATGVRKIGGRGMEVKRFKGLGEMNADQLWETTMDPQRRVLLRVKADEAEEAERMFSILMGDDVALRRDFIEQNALAVKNLDV